MSKPYKPRDVETHANSPEVRRVLAMVRRRQRAKKAASVSDKESRREKE